MRQFQQLHKLSTNLTRSISTNVPVLSHIGKAPIYFPREVSLKVSEQTLNLGTTFNSPTQNVMLTVNGPLGSQDVNIHKFVNLEVAPAVTEAGNQILKVFVDDKTQKVQKAMWGTTRALINNAIVGVTDGYVLPLKLVGVGYRATLENNKIGLKLGYSHPIEIDIPEGISVNIPQPTKIILNGIDKQKVHQFAAKIRKWREPEPYNLKGIFVGDETITKKDGKKK